MSRMCTWRGCLWNGAHSRVGQDGEWAFLCEAHHTEMEAVSANASISPGGLMRAWALAGHNHEKRKKDLREMSESTAALLQKLGMPPDKVVLADSGRGTTACPKCGGEDICDSSQSFDCQKCGESW